MDEARVFKTAQPLDHPNKNTQFNAQLTNYDPSIQEKTERISRLREQYRTMLEKGENNVFFGHRGNSI